jgi:acyl carrier protein
VEESAIADRIKRFLGQQFPATKKIGNKDLLLTTGLIDSLGILEVVSFLEKEFGIVISDDELLPENFGSVQSLSSFVRRKSNGTCP